MILRKKKKRRFEGLGLTVGICYADKLRLWIPFPQKYKIGEWVEHRLVFSFLQTTSKSSHARLQAAGKGGAMDPLAALQVLVLQEIHIVNARPQCEHAKGKDAS